MLLAGPVVQAVTLRTSDRQRWRPWAIDSVRACVIVGVTDLLWAGLQLF